LSLGSKDDSQCLASKYDYLGQILTPVTGQYCALSPASEQAGLQLLGHQSLQVLECLLAVWGLLCGVLLWESTSKEYFRLLSELVLLPQPPKNQRRHPHSLFSLQ
jgi:hypothetical protein